MVGTTARLVVMEHPSETGTGRCICDMKRKPLQGIRRGQYMSVWHYRTACPVRMEAHTLWHEDFRPLWNSGLGMGTVKGERCMIIDDGEVSCLLLLPRRAVG